MRAPVVVLSLIVLAAAGVTAAPAAERVSADAAVIARIMALAEVDLQLRQAELGLVGSTLASAHESALPVAHPAETARASATAPAVPPSPLASPVSKTAPASAGVSER